MTLPATTPNITPPDTALPVIAPPDTTAPPLKPAAPFALRTGILLMLAIVCERVFWLLQIVAPAERIHFTIPLLWAIDFFFFQRRTRVQANAVAVIVAMAAIILMLFRALLVDQAKWVQGRADWVEVWIRFYFVCSLFIIYGVIAALLTWAFQRIPFIRRALDGPRGWVWREIRKALAILIVAPYLLPFLNIHRFKVPNTTNPQRELGLAYTDVVFPAATDGARLSGWYIPRWGSDAVVVVSHGLGANKANFLGIAPFLHRAGFNVLMFDFRGHGDSTGHTISFGYYEARDVQGAVDFARSQPGIRRIATYGFSMGGAAVLQEAALQAATRQPEVAAVVVDSTFADFLPLVRDQVAYLPAGLDTAMLQAVNFYTHLELGIDLADISPQRSIAQIAPRPLLIIHGLDDTFIPPAQARRNFALAGEPKRLWLVPGANHCLCHLIDPLPYEKRVAAFLRASLDMPDANANGTNVKGTNVKGTNVKGTTDTR